MNKPYRILYQGGTGEIIEKKSRFIANLRPVKTEEEALIFIEEMRKRYYDARHNCYAWIVGKEGQQKRCSDDGEPSQTAGRPMLDVLEGAEITDICVVVTRYFGGTLLGTGGLVRAYSGAVAEGLSNSTVLSVNPARRLIITTDYNGVGKIQYLLAQNGISVLEQTYTDRVTMTVLVPEEEMMKLQDDVTQVTNAKAGLELLKEELYYAIHEKKVLLF